MKYINNESGISLAQGVLKRPLQNTISQSYKYKNYGQPIPKHNNESDYYL